MTRTAAITIALASLLLGGCSGARRLWPWAREEGVPVTKPTQEDRDVAIASPADAGAASPPAAPTPAASPAAVESSGGVTVVDVTIASPAAPLPAPAPVAPAPPGPPRPRIAPPETVEQPTDLTDLLRGPKVAAAPGAPSAGGAEAVRPGPPRPSPVEPAAPAPIPGPVVPAPAPVAPSPAPAVPAHTPLPVGHSEVVAASAVQVNNRFITVEEVVHSLRVRVKDLPPQVGEERFRQQVAPWIAEELRDEITRALVLEEANKRLTDEQKKAVDTEVKQAEQEMLAHADGSKTRLRQMLAQEGATLEQAIAEHRERAVFKLYLRTRFMPAIVITRTMLWDHYRLNQGQYTTGKKVQMQLIAAPFARFLPEDVRHPSEAETQAARAKAKETVDQALAALAGGEDFAAVAKRLSRGVKAAEGGVWPVMAADTFREAEVEKAAFSLAEGRYVGPVETASGYYVVKALKVQPGRIVPFEEAQQEIEETLRNRLYLEQTQKYFKDLLEKAHVVQSDRFLNVALDKAVERYWRR